LVDTLNRIKMGEIINLAIYVTNVTHQKEHRIKRSGVPLQNK